MKLVAGTGGENPIGGIQRSQDCPPVEVGPGKRTAQQPGGHALALGSDGYNDDHRVERPEGLDAQQLESLTTSLLQRP